MAAVEPGGLKLHQIVQVPQPFREKSLHRFLPEIPRNFHVNLNRKFQTGMPEFESSLVSQPGRSLEIYMVL